VSVTLVAWMATSRVQLGVRLFCAWGRAASLTVWLGYLAALVSMSAFRKGEDRCLVTHMIK
jgi:hypothetical protein